jgi:TolB-like protein
MKKTTIIVALFTLMLPAVLLAGPYDDMADELMSKKVDKKKAIAVMPFSYSGGGDTGILVAEEVTKAMVKDGAKIVERSQVDKILKEFKIQQTGMISDASAMQIGKGLGAKYIVVGSVAGITKPGYQNPGLKINGRLINVETFQVVSAGGCEVDAEDKSSVYRNKGPRKKVEYPGFIGFYGGATFIDYTGYYDHITTDVEQKVEIDFGTNVDFGMKYVEENTGVYTGAYEFFYSRLSDSDTEYTFQSLSLNKSFILRLPLWVYAPSLPDLTNFYFGPSIGLTLSHHTGSPDSPEDTSYGIGINLFAFAGIQFSITDNISLFTEYRYLPTILNRGFHSHTSDDESVLYGDHFEGHKFIVGFYFAP